MLHSAWDTGSRGKERKKKKIKTNDSAISKFRGGAGGMGLKRWISTGLRWWREGGISAPLICAAWLKAAPALALHRNGNCLIGCKPYERKNLADNVFIKYILWPPSWLDIFLLTYNRYYRCWGDCCVGFFMCMVTACRVENFKQGCMKFNHLILNYKPLAAKAIFEMEILLIHRFLCLF